MKTQEVWFISIHALREEGDRPVRVGDLSDIEISIHALREEGDMPIMYQARDCGISIHALREEGDTLAGKLHEPPPRISIHALREEGDSASRQGSNSFWVFLSTPSARRATREPMALVMIKNLFLSTPSARRATALVSLFRVLIIISIHALREEGDWPRPGCPFVS